MYVTTNYIEEVDTPEGKAFLAKFKAKYPDEPYVNQEAANSYIAMNLYKQLVERANGSTNRADLLKVLGQGDVCFDGPSGKVCLDPKSQHMSHTIFLARVTEDHKIEFPKVWTDIKPYWLGDAGCDLTKNDPSAQYTPSSPPPKN
jgi:branched-chain amino acid transport system substrate-binding protein